MLVNPYFFKKNGHPVGHFSLLCCMQQPISLQHLNELIKTTLDRHLQPGYWVIAEIGEFRDSVRGHVYLDLIEKNSGQITAKIRGNIWSYSYQGIRRKFESTTGERLRSGMQILALVNVQFHEVYGISLIVKDIDPNYTLGERAKRRQEIIDQLTKEGLITLNKQFELPPVPQRIAVISSVTAAGYGDFINQLTENAHHYAIAATLFQATMQGNETPASIIAAIEEIEETQKQRRFDLIVIIRGGGAQTDMDGFDDYDLAKAIANTTLPVVTGIGHERDECIADLVAHTAMKTPTAVAAFILSGFRDFEDRLNIQLNLMERRCRMRLQQESRLLEDREHMMKNIVGNTLSVHLERLDRRQQQVTALARHRVSIQYLKLENQHRQLKKMAKSTLESSTIRLGHLQQVITRLDPKHLFEKGYTRTELAGKPIQNQKVRIGDEIVTYTRDKKLTSTLTEINTHDAN
jgi:exodeoxyribonuclease VII large subunit